MLCRLSLKEHICTCTKSIRSLKYDSLRHRSRLDNFRSSRPSTINRQFHSSHRYEPLPVFNRCRSNKQKSGPNKGLVKLTQRLQHTQAARESDEVPETRSSSLQDGEVEAVVDTIQDDETNTAEASEQVKDKLSSPLIWVVGRYLPSAVPIVKAYASVPADLNDAENAEGDFRIELVNEEFEIACTRAVTLSEHTQASLQVVFSDLSQEYRSKIDVHLPRNEKLDRSLDTAHYTSKLRSMLGLEPVRVDRTEIEYYGADTEKLKLWSAQAFAGDEPLGKSQLWPDPKIAERLARISASSDVLKRAEQAAIDLDAVKLQSSSKSAARGRRALPSQQELNNKIYEAPMSQDCLSSMVRTLRELQHAGLPDEVDAQPLDQLTVLSKTTRRNIRYLQMLSQTMRLQYFNDEVDPAVKALQQQRASLSIRQRRYRTQILQMIKDNDVFVMVSETGSGKTTQLPQILLEKAILSGYGAMCNIICTQPRRIAATSVAARVAQERGTFVGGSVGYHVRFDARLPRLQGSINFSTAGVLLKRLQDDSEAIFNDISHIIVDEIHERDLTVDLLLCFLRELLRTRKSMNKRFPKIILMSATVKSIDYEQYFAEPHDSFIPRTASMTIPGRLYPITTHTLDDIVPALLEQYNDETKHMMPLIKASHQYLRWEDEFAERLHDGTPQVLAEDDTEFSVEQTESEDPFRDAEIPYALISATIAHTLSLEDKGDILVFLPGMKEIEALLQVMTNKLSPDLGMNDPNRIKIFKLHSALYETNAQVFEPIPSGCRRIILSTNIAQTSITLPGITHVIDSAKQREMIYDQISRKYEFTSAWIDKSTSLQRKGRAGRVKSGHYWGMFTDARYQSMPEKSHPGILIADLSAACLILKSYSNSIKLQDFFAKTLAAPDPKVVAACVEELTNLGMLTPDEVITPMGKFCSDFPLPPAKARGLLMGHLFRCFEPLMIIASHEIDTPLIQSTVGRKDQYLSTLAFASVSDDDRFAYVQAFQEYDEAVQQGSSADVSSLEAKQIKHTPYQIMLNVGRQIYELVADYGLVDGSLIESRDRRDSAFRLLPRSTNTNSDRLNLFKALALSVMQNNLAVWDEEFQSWLVRGEKCMLKPYGVNTKESLRIYQRPLHRKPGELLGFSDLIKHVTSSEYPWLTETSSVTPLMAMLFGGPITMLDDHTIEINGWLKYQIQASLSAESRLEYATPAAVIFEFRKALDRFLTLAFSDLTKNASSMEPEYDLWRFTASGETDASIRVQSYSLGQCRDILTERLGEILDMDSSYWDDIIHGTRSS